MQVEGWVQKLCTNLKVTSCVGTKDTYKPGSNIVVTVPGWIENKLGGRQPLDLKNLKMIIYDEADEIFLQEKNHVGISKLLSHCREKLQINAQSVFFSATFDPMVIENIEKFYKKVQVFKVKKESLKLKGVKMFRIDVPSNKKKKFIGDVYTNLDQIQTMIFCNQKVDASNLQEKLINHNIKAEKLTSEMQNQDRDAIIIEFRKQVITSIICTNVLARGIDVPEVDLVINYDVPMV